jgi:hypothetical protein
MFWRWKEEKAQKGRKSQKFVLGEAADACLDRKEAAREEIARVRAQQGAGHIEGLQIGTAEGATGDVLCRHFHDAINRAAGLDADDAGASPTAVPKAALRIHSRTVGHAAIEAGEKGPLPGDVARGGIVIVDVDRVEQRVGEVEVGLVGAPRQGVRNADVAFALQDRAVGIDAEEDAIGTAAFHRGPVGCDVVAHGTHPEGSARIGATVVEAHVGPAGKMETMVAAFIRSGGPVDQARAEGDGQGAGTSGESEGRDRLVKDPGADGFRRIEAVNEEAVDVGPVEGLFFGAPDGAFAAKIASP